MVSAKSGQVAIAADHVLTEYCWYVWDQVGVIGVRGFILRFLICTNSAHIRGARAVDGARDPVG